MGLLDAILPKKYKNSRTLYEEDLDAWRQKTEDYLNTVNLNLQQLGIDAFGSDYEFNNDGHATEAITLEQYIYNIIDGTTPIDGTSSDTFIINSDGNASTLTTASMTAPRTHTLPDIAGTFMMLEGTQTASGVKTFNNIVPKVVGPAAGRATLVNANTATDRTLTIPDPGASSELVALAGNQTVTGVKTFSTPPAFTQATGTAPFSVSSTTLVNNLHAATADAATNATNATNAANIAIVDDTTTNATMYPTWVAATTGNNAAKVSSSKISFNPSTGVLSSTFSGNLTGNVTGNCSGSSGSCTGNAATATTANYATTAGDSDTVDGVHASSFSRNVSDPSITNFTLDVGTSGAYETSIVKTIYVEGVCDGNGALWFTSTQLVGGKIVGGKVCRLTSAGPDRWQDVTYCTEIDYYPATGQVRFDIAGESAWTVMAMFQFVDV